MSSDESEPDSSPRSAAREVDALRLCVALVDLGVVAVVCGGGDGDGGGEVRGSEDAFERAIVEVGGDLKASAAHSSDMYMRPHAQIVISPDRLSNLSRFFGDEKLQIYSS